MKQLISIVLLLISFAIGADYRPFLFENANLNDSTEQQATFDYMLQYKLWGTYYIKMGRRVIIPDKSGWNGSTGPISSAEGLSIGGPVLTNDTITLGDQCQMTTGPIRGKSLTTGNDNGQAFFAGNICLKEAPIGQTLKGIERGEGKLTCDSVPEVNTKLTMPVVLPYMQTSENTHEDIILTENDQEYTIEVPKGEGQYDLYFKNIHTCVNGKNGCKLYIHMEENRLTRLFVDSLFIGNHTSIRVILGDSILPQNKYKGNVLIYSAHDIVFDNTDNVPIQGSFITPSKISLKCNLDFAGQLLANYLEIGDDFNGESFRFVKYDPDTLDFPELNKQGGLRENDSTVIIPISLSDTATIDVYFTYCFDLKDGVTVQDFNIPPELPFCGEKSITTKIPIGQQSPLDTIKVNVAIDTLTEPNDVLIMRIDSISGAVLPNGETSGELKIKIIDSDYKKNYPIDILIAHTDTVPENATINTLCGLVEAKDGNDVKVTYAIDDTVNFRIDPVFGTISTHTLFDYETQNKYPIVVNIISEDGSVKDTNLVIYIGDVDEPVYAHDTTLTVKENTTGIIGKVTGEDKDGKPVKYSCDSTLYYTVDPNSGTIRLVEPYDYEKTKVDTLKVFVSDVNGNVDTATVVVNVQNVNEKPELQPNDSLSVQENCKSCTVGKVIATDPDNDKLTYTIKEPGFAIDSNGVIKTTQPLDYETNSKITVTVTVKDPSGAADSAKYVIKVIDVNEPVHTKDTTCTVKENYTGNVCKITGTDDDGKKPTFIVTDTTNYKIDSTGQLIIKKPIDYEKKTKDTIKVIVTDGEFSDTANVIIRVLDEPEHTQIISIDDKPKQDTIRTNEQNHEVEYKICEGVKCDYDTLDVNTRRDTTVRVCNAKKTSCDSVTILFNDAPPVVILKNANSTEAYVDYITIEEQKDDKIYVNKKNNEVQVIVRDTVHKTEKHFDINVLLDTIPTKDIKLKDYNYLIDESLATTTSIGNNRFEMKEVVKDGDTQLILTKIVDKKGKPVDTTQTITYTKKVNDKDVTISYKVDNLTGTRIGNYNISYNIDSCTTVTYQVNDDKKIVKNKEGNIAYEIAYNYVDDFGNKANASVEIVFDNIPPKVEILDPTKLEKFNTNAVAVKWTVNGEVQDTLTLQRLERGVNNIIRRYVDKAGNVSADTVTVFMKEAKDINIELINPVTKVDNEKVDEYYKDHKYDTKKPYSVTFVSQKDDSLPETIGVGFKVDVVLPSVSPTGSLATLDDIVKNGQIPVDDKGNVVGASTITIPVEQYVDEHCTDEFKKDFKKNGVNIPLYDVTYSLHLWVYTNNANYVNDFVVEFKLNDEAKTTSAGTVQMVIDWLTDKDGHVKAKNGHALGTGAYITNLISKSVAQHRCDFKDQKKGGRTVRKDETMKTFGYKRPLE